MKSVIGRRCALGLACVSWLVSTSGKSVALPFGRPPPHDRTPLHASEDDDTEATDTTFAGEFGLRAARAALTLGGNSRLRQLRAFAASDVMSAPMQRQVAETLHDWLQEEPVLTAAETLALVRALAPLVDHELARKQLKRLMVHADVRGTSNGALVPSSSTHARQRAVTNTLALVSQTAALALAKSNRADATSELGQWLRRPNVEAEYAAQALLLAPPQDVRPLLEASGPVTHLLLRTLARLRRPETEAFIRHTLKRATAPVQAAAAQALLDLGVHETLDLALHWLDKPDVAPELLQVSTQILFHYRHPGRKRAFTRLVQAAPLLALDTAARHTDHALLVLGDHLSALPDTTSRKRALSHVARVGQAAVPLLSKILATDPELAVTATALLARMPSTEATDVLRDSALGRVSSATSRSMTPSAKTQPAGPATLGVLGLTVSALRGNADVEHTRALLEAQLPTQTDAQRYAVKLGLAALDVNWARKWLASDDPLELTIAAAVAGVHDASYRAHAGRRLAEFHERPLDPKALALAPALSALSSDVSLPSTLLEAWAETSLPVAYPAVWQLCTRLPMTPHGPVTRWLASDDPELRAAVYQGLGTNPDRRYTAPLLSALHTEVDPWARRSLTAALSQRPPIPPVRQALQREKNYNPDPVAHRVWRESRNVGPEDYWLDARAKARAPRSYWLMLSSIGYAPVSVPLAEGLPLLFFLPDARPLDADVFRAKTQDATLPPQ